MPRRTCRTALLFAGLAACADPGPRLSPAVGTSFGYAPVRLDGLQAGGLDARAVQAVWFGDVRGWDLEAPDADTLLAWTQGSPTPGRVDVRIETAGASLVLEDAYTWVGPEAPELARVMGFGASLTQGVQSGVPTQRGALVSPVARIARQAGAWLPLPLLVDPLFPRIEPGDIGPAPDCQVPEVVDFVSGAAPDVIRQLVDPETGSFGFFHGRVDPDLAPALVAVGGTNLGDVVHGVDPEDFGVQFVAHLAYDPYGDIGAPVPYSQLELLEAAAPTLVLATDLYGNDVIGAIVTEGTIDVGAMTSEQAFRADLAELLQRLDATGAEIVLATLPRPSLLPATEEQRRRMAADGMAAEEIEAVIAEVDARAATFDALLLAARAEHPRLHVVDLATEVERIAAEGLPVGDEVLQVAKFGGLLSLDGVHFSDTGYALLANLFADTLEAELGLDVPRIDLADVLARDPYAPDALRAAGLDPDACE